MPRVRASERALAAERQLRVGQRGRASHRQLGGARRAHRCRHAFEPGARPGSTGAARPPVHHEPRRRPCARRRPGHRHRLHLPSGRVRGHAHRGLPGAYASGCGAAPSHLPPWRPLRVSRQRGRQHGRGLRLRPGHRTAHAGRSAVHGYGWGHELPGADPGDLGRVVRLSRQPGPQQPDALRDRGGRRPPEAPGHRACRRRLPRHLAFSPDGKLLFAANQRSSTVSVFHVDGSSGELRLAGEPFASPVAVCAVPL